MDLLLWRHAEAVEGLPDSTRELTERGVRQAHKVAEWLESRRPKKLRVLVSPTALHARRWLHRHGYFPLHRCRHTGP